MGKRNAARIARLAWPTVLLFITASVSSVPALGQTRRGGDPKPILAVADLYYKNNDISDKAAVQYRKVRDQFPNSKEAEKAQYFLGSYYHRKFYIQREKKLKEDYGLLVEAQGQYEDYASRYAWKSKSPDWLADAYFNLALVFLQRGENKKGEEFLGKMYGAAPYDRTTYVYQVIWSPNNKDIIDSTFDSKQLAEYANSLIYSYAYGQQRVSKPQGPPFDTIVEKIKLWCKGRKSLK
jgi:tetratricopeptide (TPR) repeat protein